MKKGKKKPLYEKAYTYAENSSLSGTQWWIAHDGYEAGYRAALRAIRKKKSKR